MAFELICCTVAVLEISGALAITNLLTCTALTRKIPEEA
jgi:hypothetical protein